MGKKITKLIGGIAIIAAICLAFLGFVKTDSGSDNLFIVENKLEIRVTEEDGFIEYSFANLSDEVITDIVVKFGIKDDKNYSNEIDEVTISIKALSVSEENTYDFVFDINNFLKGKNFKGDNNGETFIGTGIEKLEEYDYVHEISIAGKVQKFNNGGKVATQFYIYAAIAAVIGVIVLLYSRKLPDPTPVTSVDEPVEDVNNDWQSSETSSYEPPREEIYANNEHTQEMLEEQQKYIDSMEVIDMNKDEL